MHPTIMDIEEIRRYLPHRYPFLLIDRVTDIEVGKYIQARPSGRGQVGGSGAEVACVGAHQRPPPRPNSITTAPLLFFKKQRK